MSTFEPIPTNAWNDRTIEEFSQEDAADIRGLLLGHAVDKVSEDHLQLDDGTLLRILPNEGCGGCSSGWYELAELNGCQNVITNVELAHEEATTEDAWDEPDQTYRIFVFAEDKRINLATVEGNDGNGYYGTGYSILVRRPTTHPTSPSAQCRGEGRGTTEGNER